jgi:hypothetical protein
MSSRRRVNFYEAGSGQEEIRFDWFTLLFEVIQLDSLAIIKVVASLNWCDEAHSQATRFALKLTPELFVISITFPNLLSSHSSWSEVAQATQSIPPGPHLRDYFSLRCSARPIAKLPLRTGATPSAYAAWPSNAPITYDPPPPLRSSSVIFYRR